MLMFLLIILNGSKFHVSQISKIRNDDVIIIEYKIRITWQVLGHMLDCYLTILGL